MAYLSRNRIGQQFAMCIASKVLNLNHSLQDDNLKKTTLKKQNYSDKKTCSPLQDIKPATIIATSSAKPLLKANHSTVQSLDELVRQSEIFCSDSKFLREILGIGQITKSSNVKEFFTQILSRDLGTIVKTKTYFFGKKIQKKIESDIFKDIDKAVVADPVEPTPFQVAVTFIGTKALMTYRFAHELWNSGDIKDAKQLSSSALSNYHVDIHPSAQIDAGIFIDHGFGIQIKEKATIGSGTYILHGTKIGEHAEIGKNAFIGANVTINPRIKIGDNVTIAAGTHVTSNIADNQTSFGLYSDTGSHKIIPSRIHMPESMLEYYNEYLESSEPSLYSEKINTLNILKSLIPYNPNSPLTIENLENFYHQSKDVTSRETKHIGDLAFTATQIAHIAWQQAHSDKHNDKQQTAFRNFSLWLQGRIATIFKIDIHPAAIIDTSVRFPEKIERGIVIGSTASIDKNTYIGDGSTLGGTGKERGDRHPKISENCFIGDNSMVLGAGRLGAGSVIMPNSIITIPKGEVTPNERIWAGKPAVDVTEKCQKIPLFKEFLDRLKKQN